MPTHNPNNERIKRQYFTFLKEAKRQSVPTIDAVAKALSRFEETTRQRDFKAFHYQQAVAFKNRLSEQQAQRSKKNLSKATLYSTFAHLKRFFQWLAVQPGYKSRLKYSDAEYFNLSDKDSRIATARRDQSVPTIEQIKHVLAAMPTKTDLERRDRALVAFTLLTGARDSAIASLKLKHVDLVDGCVRQDAREVQTKFSKTFNTYFFPVGDDVLEMFQNWVHYLRETLLWGDDDPLFPSTRVTVGKISQKFETDGLDRVHWSSAEPIRKIFRRAFETAGLPYFNPHSLRNTLVRLGEKTCQSPEQFKAWSQNLGHEGVLTTFYSYGEVVPRRQAEIILSLRNAPQAPTINEDVLADAVVRKLLERRQTL